MLHRSSGRDNFGLVKPNNKNESAYSQQQISDDQARTIQQKTREAIQTAAGTAHENNSDNNKNPK